MSLILNAIYMTTAQFKHTAAFQLLCISVFWGFFFFILFIYLIPRLNGGMMPALIQLTFEQRIFGIKKTRSLETVY